MSFPYFCDGSESGKGAHWMRGARCERCGISMPAGEPLTRNMLFYPPKSIEPEAIAGHVEFGRHDLGTKDAAPSQDAAPRTP